MLKPLGELIKIAAFIDSDHASNLVTRRSQKGYIIFCNQSPILWYSKRQNTVEASTFGAEFVVARTCLEAIEAVCFKLRMFGIPVEGPADVLCDNNGVVNNTQMLGFPKICEWRMLGCTRVNQSRAIGQTWTKPETPGLTRPWWNNGHGHMTQTRSHAQHHGGSTNDSPVQVSPKEKTK